MAIAIVNQTSGGSTPITIPTPTAGNLLVLVAIEISTSANTWGTHSISGSPGGNFTAGTGFTRGTAAHRVVVSGDSTSVTIGNGGGGFRAFIFELSGMDTTSPFDRAAGTTFASASSAASPLGAAIAQAEEFVVTIFGHNGTNGTPTGITDSFTHWTPTDTRRGGGYRTTSSVVTPNPTLSWPTARAGQYVISAWKGAAAAAADMLDPMGMTGFFGA